MLSSILLCIERRDSVPGLSSLLASTTVYGKTVDLLKTGNLSHVLAAYLYMGTTTPEEVAC